MSKNAAAKKLNVINEYDFSPIVDWVTENGKTILYGFAAIICILLITYKILSIRTNNAEADYLNAETAYQNIQSDQEKQENLDQLNAILSRNPDLKAKYDSSIAQLLIIDQDATQATPYAESLFKRTANQGVDLYREYGETSLLIASEQYQDALERSIALKLKMNNSDESGTQLYGLNLVRIAVLQQVLNHPKDELAAWNDVQNYAGFAEISPLFADGQVTLKSYIDSRKQSK